MILVAHQVRIPMTLVVARIRCVGYHLFVASLFVSFRPFFTLHPLLVRVLSRLLKSREGQKAEGNRGADPFIHHSQCTRNPVMREIPGNSLISM